MCAARYGVDDAPACSMDSANIEINVGLRPDDCSFGIHGQPDKTVCLMTYWHVDRHFSSCSDDRDRRYLGR